MHLRLYCSKEAGLLDTRGGSFSNWEQLGAVHKIQPVFVLRHPGGVDLIDRNRTSFREMRAEKTGFTCCRSVKLQIGLGRLCSILYPLCYSNMLKIVPIRPKIMPQICLLCSKYAHALYLEGANLYVQIIVLHCTEKVN